MLHSLLETHMYGVAQVLQVELTALDVHRVYMLSLATAFREHLMSSRTGEQKFLMQMHSQET